MTTHSGDNDALRPEDPRELGPYRLLSRLGRGGMGTVFLARDSGGRQVAVKVINRELAGEAAFRDRFEREVTAARQVRRFCTAPVLDAELENEPLYVVTEYIEGPSLERAVAERGPLPGSDLEGLAVGVATALAAIHGAGIVHRDLKPANVLLSATGPRVIDFGIARALDAAEGPTRTGQLVGTPNYLPPELLRGEPITPASDVFSWGCVVGYAGTGRAPFAGNTVPEIFYRVAHEPPKLDDLDPSLRALVGAALDKDPRNRPSVQELLARLVGTAEPNPAQLAETVQAQWHGPANGAPQSAWQPPAEAQAPAWQPPQTPPPSQRPAATALLGDGPTRQDAAAAPPAGGGDLPRKPLLIGAAAVAGVLVVGFGLYSLLGGGPPDNTASIFNDDFSTTNSGWEGGEFNPSSSESGYIGNKYRLQTQGANAPLRWRYAPVKSELPKRALITATVTPTQVAPDGQYGLLCMATDDSDDKKERAYVFLVRNDGKGAALRRWSGEQGTKEIAVPDSVPGFKANKPNKLQIACESEDGGKAARLRLWVNGDQVLDETDKDGALTGSSVGLLVNRGGNAAQEVVADFDDYGVAKIND
ncbi:serine/threonine-protein kinase [Actinomadura hibisca]|uniref:serine/threonine-protein kinase n=1 Tax=Actinomadura hibisca TaxID=68565 RepID=UPI00082FD0C7|nr:serine/threonine-protein kinase [Actinomadura hibisca]